MFGGGVCLMGVAVPWDVCSLVMRVARGKKDLAAALGDADMSSSYWDSLLCSGRRTTFHRSASTPWAMASALLFYYVC
jgi:hypothetical protein